MIGVIAAEKLKIVMRTSPQPESRAAAKLSNQPNLEALNKSCERSITKMSDDEALEHIGRLIDDSCDAAFERGLKRALYLLDELSKRPLSEENAVLTEYFRANA